MEEKSFVWTTELTKKLCQMKFDHDWLFKKRKQPWAMGVHSFWPRGANQKCVNGAGSTSLDLLPFQSATKPKKRKITSNSLFPLFIEFYKILQENGFPEEMTIDHVRKKWSYTWDTYRIAKRNRNKTWKYYKLFEKHYGKKMVLDKFESWSDEWRLKLITCIAEGKQHNLDTQTMWRAVERAMRSQDLPLDCCIQDMKGLWHHLKMTFARKHRLIHRKKIEATEWPLYEVMLDYHKKYENVELNTLEAEMQQAMRIPMKGLKKKKLNRTVDNNDEENEFNWTKNITESFIQVRLQNDWLFRERNQPWKVFVAILRNEYGFPTTLSSREACRKWSTIFSDYQKAKATNNTSWVYYTLFELYLGEGKLSLNPLADWQEEWVFNLISARTDLEHVFEYSHKDRNEGWREVEKRLRSIGVPLDHSLLDLPEIWSYLRRTFRWKSKFKNKGILTEQWPYYEAMAQYTEKPKPEIERQKRTKQELNYDETIDDFEDDIKLFDLKQKLDLKPKVEIPCRACADIEASVDLFGQKDDDGADLASKLKVIGGIEVERSDNLPSQICYNCLQELENAYKFRRKCQKADAQLRSLERKIKLEFQDSAANDTCNDDNNDDMDRSEDVIFETPNEQHGGQRIKIVETISKPDIKATLKKEKIVRRRRKVRKLRYDYWKICEVCGKNTKNLGSHLDTHNLEKKYSCEVCDKKFKFKSGLIIHKAVHDPTPRKTCEICGKTFHILAQYRRHFVYHANERKFECETCGKRFNTLDILRVHNMTHTDERPFTCSECGKTFRTAGCVSRHKRIVHRNTKKLQ